MYSNRTALSSATTAYGRSRSTPARRVPPTAVATSGNPRSTAAATRNPNASTANTTRYAAGVSRCSATPPSPAPTASPVLSADWRNARTLIRRDGSTSPAGNACRAAWSPLCPHAYTAAANRNPGSDRTTRNAANAPAVTTASVTASRRAPNRSARCPSGTPATAPTAQAIVSTNPTSVGLSLTTRVKYSADDT